MLVVCNCPGAGHYGNCVTPKRLYQSVAGREEKSVKLLRPFHYIYKVYYYTSMCNIPIRIVVK